MERLTKRLEDGQAVMDCQSCELREDACTVFACRNRLKDRLAAYEDTGLNPEEVLGKEYAGEVAMALILSAEYRAIGSIDHLRELVQAEKNGRLSITPKTVWCKGDSGLREVPYRGFMANWLGKKFWLTRKEAEAAPRTENLDMKDKYTTMEKSVLEYIVEILDSPDAGKVLTGYQKQALDAVSELLSVCDYDQLCNLVKSKMDGRLVVLPCKVGGEEDAKS